MRSPVLVSSIDFEANKKLKMQEMLRILNLTLSDIEARTNYHNDADTAALQLKREIESYLPHAASNQETDAQLELVELLPRQERVIAELTSAELHKIIIKTEALLRNQSWLRRWWHVEHREKIQQVVENYILLLTQCADHYQAICQEDYSIIRYTALTEAKSQEADLLPKLIGVYTECLNIVRSSRENIFTAIKAIVERSQHLLEHRAENFSRDQVNLHAIYNETIEMAKRTCSQLLATLEPIKHIFAHTADRKAMALKTELNNYVNPNIAHTPSEFHVLMNRIAALLREDSFLRKDKYKAARSALQTTVNDYYEFLYNCGARYKALHVTHVTRPAFLDAQAQAQETQRKLALLKLKFSRLTEWCTMGGINPAVIARHIHSALNFDDRPIEIDTTDRDDISPANSSPAASDSEPNTPTR